MKICSNCRYTDSSGLKYCPHCSSHTAGFMLVDAAACTRCWSFYEVGKPHACHPARPSNPNVYVEYEEQNRTTWENEELARLRAEWKAKKGYDYV